MKHRATKLLAILLALALVLAGCATSPENPGTSLPDGSTAPVSTSPATEPSSTNADATAPDPGTTQPETQPDSTQSTQPQTSSPETGTSSVSGGTTGGSDASKPPSTVPATTTTQTTAEPEPEPETDKIVFHILLPEGESLITGESVELLEGDTVLSVLLRVCEAQSIATDVRGSGSTAYIAAIGEWKEREHGALSGWVYKVNGEQIPKSAGAYKLAADDEVKWVYSLDMGKDAKDR